MQPGYFLQKTPVHTGKTPLNGNDECNTMEDKRLPVRAKEDGISLFENLCQSEFITAAICFISGQKAKSVFTWTLKWGKQRGKRQPLDPVFFSIRKAMATLRVGDWINFQLRLIPRHTFNQHVSPQHLTLISTAKRDALHLNLNNCFCILAN